MAPLPSAYKADCSQYLKIFVWVACHVDTRLEQKFMIPGRSYSGPYMIPGRSYSGPYMIPGRSYSGPYMIPGRSYSGPYMIPGRSWQDHSKEIFMISMVP